MLQGNRKLAAVIAGLIAVTVTTSLAPIVGMGETVVLTAMAIEGALASGGIITFKGSE